MLTCALPFGMTWRHGIVSQNRWLAPSSHCSGRWYWQHPSGSEWYPRTRTRLTSWARALAASTAIWCVRVDVQLCNDVLLLFSFLFVAPKHVYTSMPWLPSFLRVADDVDAMTHTDYLELSNSTRMISTNLFPMRLKRQVDVSRQTGHSLLQTHFRSVLHAPAPAVPSCVLCVLLRVYFLRACVRVCREMIYFRNVGACWWWWRWWSSAVSPLPPRALSS